MPRQQFFQTQELRSCVFLQRSADEVTVERINFTVILINQICLCVPWHAGNHALRLCERKPAAFACELDTAFNTAPESESRLKFFVVCTKIPVSTSV